MKVTMLKNVKHKNIKYCLGSEYDLSEVLANDWINSKYAEQVRRQEGNEETEEVKPRTSRRIPRGGSSE